MLTRILLLLSCMAVIFSGCSDKEDVKTQNHFEIAESQLQHNFTKDEANILIPVSTNLETEDWQVKSDVSWCIAAKSFGTKESSIRISVLASTEPGVRSTEIKVTSPIENYVINVSQLGYGPAILLKNSNPTINSDGGTLNVTVTANVEYTYRFDGEYSWITEAPASRGLVDYDYSFLVDTNPQYEDRNAVLTFASTQDDAVNATCTIIQEAKTSSVSDVELEGDIQIKPTGGQASEQQSGWGIDRTYDDIIGDPDKHYHSRWNGLTELPVTLEYFFDGTEEIDYFIYHSRSGNGNFGKLKVYTATAENPEYTLQGEFDFKQQNASSKENLATSVKATKVKFVVSSGLGGYVSCDEMQFFKRNTEKVLDKALLTVFTDITCSELKAGVTTEQINALPGYFARIAVELKNNTYNEHEKSFRIRDYAPYSDVEVWAERLMTKRYSNLDNPTGILVTKGDSIVVLVGSTNGQKLALQCIQTIEPSGDMYFLEEGVNEIGIRNTGMLFLMYTTDLTSPNSKPIRVHIPLGSGTVDGFFDLKEHKNDEKYAELLSKATHKYFCIKGEKIMFYFHRTKLVEVVPRNILSAINLWDNMIGWQQELMGIEDVRPSQVNNHIFAVSPEQDYMWASDYRIGFVYTYLNNILLYDNVMAAKDNAWGPAHEIGHIHQQAINWPGSTESSNNLFSNYTLYKLGKYCSRGSELSELATIRCIDNRPWCDFGDGHQGENTEMHMRMNWQLWNYYHRCGYNTKFFQTLFKLLREDRIIESDPGAGQLKFARMASKAANQNLTDFFEMWGFFVPVNMTLEQYGTYNYKVTDAMISETKNYMAQFPAPKHAMYYLEDRKSGDVGIENYQVGDVGHYEQFKNNTKITKKVNYTRSGQTISISNGNEAVAFEIHKSGKMVFFSNFLTFDVPQSISLDGTSVYAVQADGERIAAGRN